LPTARFHSPGERIELTDRTGRIDIRLPYAPVLGNVDRAPEGRR